MEGKTSGDLTLLERKAIGTASEKMYQKELKAFMDYAGCRGLNLKEGETVDRLMVQYMNHCYLAGHQAYVGDRLIASWMHHYPEYSKSGVRKIPRALRCLKGWRRLCPGRSRVPYPLSVWCAVCPGMFDDGTWISHDGRFCDASPLHLQPPFRAFEAEDIQPRATSAGSDWELESFVEPRRVAGAIQDGRFRREHPVGLSLYQLLGWEDSENSEGQ